MTTYAYLRLSREGGTDCGIDAQRADLERYAAAFGITITHWHEERASAREDSPRPVLEDVRSRLRAGDVLLAARVDRVTRSVSDSSDLLK